MQEHHEVILHTYNQHTVYNVPYSMKKLNFKLRVVIMPNKKFIIYNSKHMSRGFWKQRLSRLQKEEFHKQALKIYPTLKSL